LSKYIYNLCREWQSAMIMITTTIVPNQYVIIIILLSSDDNLNTPEIYVKVLNYNWTLRRVTDIIKFDFCAVSWRLKIYNNL